MEPFQITCNRTLCPCDSDIIALAKKIVNGRLPDAIRGFIWEYLSGGETWRFSVEYAPEMIEMELHCNPKKG